MSREVEFRGKDKYGNWIYDEYVNEDYCCDDWNDDDEKAYWISESKGC